MSLPFCLTSAHFNPLLFTHHHTASFRLLLQVANEIRHLLKDYNKTIPTVLEIPSKDSPYDPEQDYIMQRVSQLIGGEGK